MHAPVWSTAVERRATDAEVTAPPRAPARALSLPCALPLPPAASARQKADARSRLQRWAGGSPSCDLPGLPPARLTMGARQDARRGTRPARSAAPPQRSRSRPAAGRAGPFAEAAWLARGALERPERSASGRTWVPGKADAARAKSAPWQECLALPRTSASPRQGQSGITVPSHPVIGKPGDEQQETPLSLGPIASTWNSLSEYTSSSGSDESVSSTWAHT